MTAIQKLALRNLKEHKSKTVIISLFLIFGIAIVIMGNSFLESINKGLEKDFKENYTGDITISIKPKKGQTIDIFSASSSSFTMSMDDFKIPAIPDLESVMNVVNTTKGISKNTKLISSQVLVMYGTEIDFNAFTEEGLGFDDMPIAMLFAGEDETYWDTFQGIHFIEGTYPSPNTNEVIIDTRVKSAYESIYKRELKVGDEIAMSSPLGTTIRDAVVCGIFKPANEYSAMFQSVYSNPSFARSFADLTFGSVIDENINYDDSFDYDNISNLSEDDLFGGSSDDDFFSDDIEDIDLLSSDFDFDSILGDTTRRDELNKTDDGAWQFVLMKVDNPFNTNKIIDELNNRFKEEEINARAMGWKLAAASYAYTVEGVGLIFNILIIILGVVVFIIIMNTMTISIIERTGEIGTMRAIGAPKGFVRKLFYTETLLLTSVSCLIGIALAFIIMAIFNSCNIAITNSIAKMILGGGLLHFSPTWPIIINTILVALCGSLLSNIYPVKSALKITPLKALSKGSV